MARSEQDTTASLSSENEKGRTSVVDDVEKATDGSFDASSSLNKSLLWKQDLRIVPLCAFIYLLCSLDRSNIGNARIMNREEGNDLMTQTNMTAHEYTIALMIFFLAYALFEVPSNIFLKKVRPSRWIAFLMFCWGVITIGMAGVTSYATLTVTRFLLGVFEAGLFPGVVYYLTFWYRPEERSVRVAMILASATLAGAFGGAIAYGIARMEGVRGLNAFRWLFILEGVPSAALAFVIVFILPDFPETASWLNAEEKAYSALRLKDSSHASSGGVTKQAVKETLLEWRLWVHYIIYFGISAPFSSMSLFAPTIVSGLGYTSLKAQLMTVPPYAVSWVVSIIVGYAADKLNQRSLFASVFAFIGAIGFIASATLPPDAFAHRYGMLIIACTGAFSCIPPLLGWLSSNMHSTSATGLAVALNISFGAPGQIVGVFIYKSEEVARGYPTGHWTNAALLLMVSVVCLLMRGVYARWNKGLKIRREAGEDIVLWRL